MNRSLGAEGRQELCWKTGDKGAPIMGLLVLGKKPGDMSWPPDLRQRKWWRMTPSEVWGDTGDIPRPAGPPASPACVPSPTSPSSCLLPAMTAGKAGGDSSGTHIFNDGSKFSDYNHFYHLPSKPIPLKFANKSQEARN